MSNARLNASRSGKGRSSAGMESRFSQPQGGQSPAQNARNDQRSEESFRNSDEGGPAINSFFVMLFVLHENTILPGYRQCIHWLAAIVLKHLHFSFY